MSKFQIILLGIFGFFIIAGVIAFATFRAGPDGEQFEPITLWGTISQSDFNRFLSTVNTELEKGLRVTYRAFPEDDFNQALLEALASGVGPDAIILPHELIERHHDKVFVLPFESFSERDFKDRFLEQGELFLTPAGTLAFPFSIDPLVLFWNRTLFANAGRSQPPQYWDELFALSEQLTERDDRGNIFSSTIAFGEFANVNHAGEILTALIMQAGGPIIVGEVGNLEAVLNDRFGRPEVPAESALRFYTEFANPVKAVYTWNRSLPPSQDAFIAGDVALYGGFASELFTLQQRNPNLNYDVTLLPQVRAAERQLTHGRLFGLAALKNSPRLESVFGTISILTQPDVLALWEDISGLPPVRRDMLAEQPTDAFMSVFYKSALISDGFHDPDPGATETIFRTLVEDITSGRERITSAVLDAQSRLSQLVR